ncbi:epithelial-stromal interaction protein 1 isoform X2 [Echeneis naucrates]|uniref:epithelial-stromal interaction protein 1 isoform X2 n=1 Tax=Echeneis naucrates TaxID=173247 RepID=UPI001113434A|nr:epithelial-stromal interaction protein 1 isoform X2 [Echeneis naucrates]
MDPYQHPRDQLSPRRNTKTGSGEDPNDPDDNTPAPDRQPRSSGFTVIPPNESRRNEMQTVAQRGEEKLQRWKETHRVSSVHHDPERLGGSGTLAEARQRQYRDSRCSKLQKKLKQEELDRRRREDEEAELQRMKAKQRQKTERLEEKERREQQRREEQFMQDQPRVMETFLQRFERSAPGPLASSSATHTSSRIEVAEIKQERSERDVELDRRRVNSAFLDKLEGRGRGGQKETRNEGGVQEPERSHPAFEDSQHQPSATATHLKPDPEQGFSSWREEVEPDYDWSLMKLMNNFPDYSKVFLEDILDQCNGDYEQAYTLLICLLS